MSTILLLRLFDVYYHVFGFINSAFIVLSLYGVFCQLSTIFERKKAMATDKQATAVLSLNQFSVSFLAYLSFFVYGYSITPFNHYIVWPRLIAAALVALILWQIWQDRKTKITLVCMSGAAVLLFISLGGLFLGGTYSDQSRLISTVLIVSISVLLAQGYVHQIRLIIDSGHTGAVNIKMSQFILLMDVSTMALALSMGLQAGWPLMVLAVTSAITKLVIIYLFYWVKVSPVAAARRGIN